MCTVIGDYLDPRILGGLWTLFTTLVGAFFGSYFDYLLAQHAQEHAHRLDTYDKATTVLAEYQVLLAKHDRPSTDFLARISQVDVQIADRFSETAYQAWRKAQSFFTDDGSLPPGKQEYDFELAKLEALGAIRKELPRQAGRNLRRARHIDE